MSEVVAQQINELQRNQKALWDKHDQCDLDRKAQSLSIARLEGQASLLSNKIDNIESSTTKTQAGVERIAASVEAIIVKQAEASGQKSGANWVVGLVFGLIGAVASGLSVLAFIG